MQHTRIASAEYDASPRSSTRALPSDARDMLWNLLQGKRLQQIVFRRGRRLGAITVDFFAPSFHLVVSVNEPGVDSKHWYYAREDAQLRHMGFRVMRFTAEEVQNDTSFVLDSIVEVVSRIAHRRH